jgi:hypothetical protein
MQPSLFSDFPEADRSKPLVLLLGNVDHEGITSSLKSGGEQCPDSNEVMPFLGREDFARKHLY